MFLQLFSEIVKLTEKLSAKFKKNCYINILFLHKCKKMLEYQNFKKFYSIVLMGLVGSHYRFVWGSCGFPGNSHDAVIFVQQTSGTP